MKQLTPICRGVAGTVISGCGGGRTSPNGGSNIDVVPEEIANEVNPSITR